MLSHMLLIHGPPIPSGAEDMTIKKSNKSFVVETLKVNGIEILKPATIKTNSFSIWTSFPILIRLIAQKENALFAVSIP